MKRFKPRIVSSVLLMSMAVQLLQPLNVSAAKGSLTSKVYEATSDMGLDSTATFKITDLDKVSSIGTVNILNSNNGRVVGTPKIGSDGSVSITVKGGSSSYTEGSFRNHKTQKVTHLDTFDSDKGEVVKKSVNVNKNDTELLNGIQYTTNISGNLDLVDAKEEKTTFSPVNVTLQTESVQYSGNDPDSYYNTRFAKTMKVTGNTRYLEGFGNVANPERYSGTLNRVDIVKNTNSGVALVSEYLPKQVTKVIVRDQPNRYTSFGYVDGEDEFRTISMPPGKDGPSYKTTVTNSNQDVFPGFEIGTDVFPETPQKKEKTSTMDRPMVMTKDYYLLDVVDPNRFWKSTARYYHRPRDGGDYSTSAGLGISVYNYQRKGSTSPLFTWIGHEDDGYGRSARFTISRNFPENYNRSGKTNLDIKHFESTPPNLPHPWDSYSGYYDEVVKRAYGVLKTTAKSEYGGDTMKDISAPMFFGDGTNYLDPSWTNDLVGSERIVVDDIQTAVTGLIQIPIKGFKNQSNSTGYAKYSGKVTRPSGLFTHAKYEGMAQVKIKPKSFKYRIQFDYEDNMPPEVNMDGGTRLQDWYSKNSVNTAQKTIKMSGSFSDPDDGDRVKMMYDLVKTDSGTQYVKRGVAITGWMSGGGRNHRFNLNLPASDISSDGKYRIELYSQDESNEKSSKRSYSFGVDTVAPTISVSDLNNENKFRNRPYQVRVTTKDDRSGVDNVSITPWRGSRSAGIEQKANLFGGTNENRDYTLQMDDGSNQLRVILIDKAGNTRTTTTGSYKFDSTMPEEPELELNVLEKDAIYYTVSNLRDASNKTGTEVSGMSKIPIKYTVKDYETQAVKVNKNWMNYNYENIGSDGLLSNSYYEFEVSVRDDANIKAGVDKNDGNVITRKRRIATKTAPITMTFNKRENNVDIVINSKTNVAGTYIMLERQNLTTKEKITLKEWSTKKQNEELKFTDITQGFMPGYKYIAHAINKDGVHGEQVVFQLRDPEEVQIELRGQRSDSYEYDPENKAIYLFGNSTGILDMRILTHYTKDIDLYVRDKGTLAHKDTIYGREDKFEYRVNVPINKQRVQEYGLELRTDIETSPGKFESKQLLGPDKFKVYIINSIKEIADFRGEDNSNGDYTVEYKVKNNVIGDNSGSFLKKKFKDLNASKNGSWAKLLDGGKVSPITKDEMFTIKKEMTKGKDYIENLNKGDIDIKTNINNYVTETDKDKPWNLEVEVTVDGKKYNLPKDAVEFKKAGYSLEAVVVNDLVQTDLKEKAKYEHLKSRPGAKVYNHGNLNTMNLVPPMNATVGIKVVDLITTYKFQTLNLQEPGSGNGATKTSLEVIGNKNFHYDSKFIYNRINNMMKPHNQKVLETAGSHNWNSEVYYRTDGKAPVLIMVLRDRVVTFDPTTLEAKDVIKKTNTGSTVVSKDLLVGSSKGLEKLSADIKFTDTSYKKGVVALTNNGTDVFVSTGTDLDILGNNLELIQTLTSSDIFGSSKQIKTLHSSNGRVYVGDSLKTNEYIELGK